MKGVKSTNRNRKPLRLASQPLQTAQPGRAHAGRRSTGVWSIYHRSLPGGSLQAELLTLNESLVLLSGCLQMMTVTREQRRADPASIKIAHNSPFVRASFPSTATMQKVMIRIAKKERGREGCNSIFFQSPTDSPKIHGEGGSISAAIDYDKDRVTDITVQ